MQPVQREKACYLNKNVIAHLIIEARSHNPRACKTVGFMYKIIVIFYRPLIKIEMMVDAAKTYANLSISTSTSKYFRVPKEIS
jgi:hypothetical protein